MALSFLRRLAAGVPLVLAAAAPAALRAQSVGLDPHVVFLTHRARTGGVTLYNTGTVPVEISLATVYGYVGTDSAGDAVVHFPARPDSTEPNAAPWIAVFPRRVTIPAGGEQEVRFQARPAEGLPDGEYWARVAVTARNAEPPPRRGDDTSAVSVRLAMETRTVIPLFYRKGELATRVLLSDVRADVEGDSLAVRAHLERGGSAAYVGTVRAIVADDAGRTVAELERPLAVYRASDPRWSLRLPTALAPGRYAVTVSLSTARGDVPAANVLQAPPVAQKVELRLPRAH